jgi:hypothetical protein
MKTHTSDTPQEWTSTFMDGCHEMTLNHLKPQIQKMFENCHLALLEFSEKAQSGTSQIQFMEAGNIIKNNRASIEGVFYDELKQGFTRFKRSCNQESMTGRAEFHAFCSDEQLTLISKEDTDIQVAIQNMVSSASLGSTAELTGIRQRLAVLNNGCKLQEKQIPAGPDALARAFHKAAAELVLEHESKLIVYLLFDKFVLSKSCPLYEKYNDRLLKAGLLQNLKYEARKNPNAPLPRRKQEQQSRQNPDDNQPVTGDNPASSGKTLGDELIDNILDLMSQNNPNTLRAHANPVAQAELVSALHKVQQNIDHNDALTHAATAPAEAVTGKQSIENMVAHLSTEREQLFQGLDRRCLPPVDTQMIDLIGMMFEYMLNDDEIPNMAKAELSRLHTPYLKVAILDKTLFTDNSHPAHRLLNDLARAGAHWVFEGNPDRGIFPCMRKIVMRIILDFKNDLGIFTELLNVLHTSLDDLDNKAVVIEEHSRQAAKGKEKLELARLCADSQIEKTVSKHTVPNAVRQMLGDVWRDKLMFIYLREAGADQSDIWRLATQTMESILWCVEPRTTIEEQENLRDRHTEVCTQIKQSIETLSAYGHSDTASEVALIREYTQAAINATDLSTSSTGNPEDTAHRDVPQDIPANVENNTVTIAPAIAAHKEEQHTSHSGVDELARETAAAMDELDALQFGTWFNLYKDTEHGPVHAKLSWYSKISGNYMFVDSMGIKVAVIMRRELADLLVSGQAEIITEGQRPLIRRAMETIRRMLVNDQTTQA